MEDFEKVSKKAKTLRIIKLTVIYTLLFYIKKNNKEEMER